VNGAPQSAPDAYTYTPRLERACGRWTRNSCSAQHVLASGIYDTRVHVRAAHTTSGARSEMRVHDDADPKYSAMGKSSKLAMKRPSTVVFRENFSKVQKMTTEDSSRSVNTTKNSDRTNVGFHQRRKSLPVYMLRKR